MSIQLRRRIIRCPVLLVAFAHFGRRLAFAPALPALWFTVDRRQGLVERASEVLSEHFRRLERAGDPVQEKDIDLYGTAWVTTIDLQWAVPRTSWSERNRGRSLFALLSSDTPLRGDQELQNVGRCLDWLYPDGLSRAFLRDPVVRELGRTLNMKPRRPVVLVGRPKVGKTSIIHEHVFRTMQQREGTHGAHRQLWLLSPQRLISGMSYVGQWEERLLAILKEARKRDHVLYFDDLVGLFHAGVSSESSLSVAHVLKPHVERRELSIISELTPEALRVLQELDRGFADLFHVIRVEEPSDRDNLSILIKLIRELEGRHECIFHPAALPRVLDLQRRHARQLAFPGKAAVYLERLAVKFTTTEITADRVIEEFHKKSGLSLTFLDDRTTLQRKDVLEALERQVIGQDPALQAMADVVSIGKARLNDPGRPLASFLFLGPTGVGKTQCAKALASYLYGSPDRLLRFDMNEHSTPDAVARLVGTFSQPRGQLTSAVAQNPFSVLLLDEIEKGHPDLFDLLLQVLDDGRLTDARGVTTDFSNTIIIMTSNLGAREAGHSIGFGGDAAPEQSVYTRAAERFFRPELFNRLDRIVAFGRLQRQHINAIARLAIRQLFEREGLVRRKTLLDIHPGALERVAHEGYQPELGARALKRSIERLITRPMAARLAGLQPDRPTVVSLFPRGDARFDLHIESLGEARHAGLIPRGGMDLSNAEPVLERLNEVLLRLRIEVTRFSPLVGFDTTRLRPVHHVYFDLNERLRALWDQVEELGERLQTPEVRLAKPVPKPHISKRIKWFCKEHDRWDVLAVQEIHEYLQELAEQALPFGATLKDQLLGHVQQLALVQAIAAAGPERTDERVALVFDQVAADEQALKSFQIMLVQSLVANLPLELVQQQPRAFAAFEGPGAKQLLGSEAGTHLCWKPVGGFHLFTVSLIPLRPGQDLNEEMSRWVEKRASLLERGGIPDVIRIYDETGSTLDLRTGLMARGDRLAPEDHRPMLLAPLPWPDELLSR